MIFLSARVHSIPQTLVAQGLRAVQIYQKEQHKNELRNRQLQTGFWSYMQKKDAQWASFLPGFFN